MNNTIKPIETIYNGYRFRSRLEARWAVFFDTLGVKYEYEKEGYDLGDGIWYLPDFWLPDVGLRGNSDPGIWVEIKGVHPSEAEETKCERLALGTNRPVILFRGLPSDDSEDYGFEYAPYTWRDFETGESGTAVGWDNYMFFFRCYTPNCETIKVEFLESNYSSCPKCGGRADESEPKLLTAYQAARSARFERLG